MKYLIVVEAEAAGTETYHHQPYRLAKSVDEARDMMQDYLEQDADSGALGVKYFALYPECGPAFGRPEYFDPVTLEVIDPAEWLKATGRC